MVELVGLFPNVALDECFLRTRYAVRPPRNSDAYVETKHDECCVRWVRYTGSFFLGPLT